MDKQEILNFLSEKKRVTAPVAAAEDSVDRAEKNYEMAKKKWRVGIVILLILTLAYLRFCSKGNFGLFYFNERGVIQAGGIGGLILFGGLSALLLYIKITRYIKPAEHELANALSILRQAKDTPAYQNGAKDFPAKFYNYSDVYHLWNFINEGRAETLKEAYNLLETNQFQQNQMEIQADIRRLQQDIVTTSKVNAAASVITAYNTAKKK